MKSELENYELDSCHLRRIVGGIETDPPSDGGGHSTGGTGGSAGSGSPPPGS